MKMLSLKLPDTVADRLESEAQSQQKPKSELVREFIVRGLNGQGAAGKQSFHSLARDKARRFRGPRDLATHPKYLDGLGQ